MKDEYRVTESSPRPNFSIYTTKKALVTLNYLNYKINDPGEMYESSPTKPESEKELTHGVSHEYLLDVESVARNVIFVSGFFPTLEYSWKLWTGPSQLIGPNVRQGPK